MVEKILEDYRKAYDFNYISLRYFNAAGAIPDNSHGYCQQPASHIVPIICRAALKEEVFVVNGNDYNTPDGTCMRDYTHVCDIANAHLASLNYLNETECSDTFNIGSGSPNSVLDIIEAVIKVHGASLEYNIGPRREGDVEKTYADISRAEQLLGWTPQYSFEQIIEHAYAWEEKHKRRK